MANIISGQYYRKGGQTGELEIFGLRSERFPTSTCNHCAKVVILKQNTTPPSYCPVCDKLVCPNCHAKGGCTTWEKQMEAMEARDRFRRAMAAL